MNRTAGEVASQPGLRVLCAPYHLYTHRKEFERLFACMHERAWQISILLPFTERSTLLRMKTEGQTMPHTDAVYDMTSHRLLALPGATLSRVGRAIALLVYFLRAFGFVLRHRPDVLLLTSDLGGVSVRFLQLLCLRMGVPIVTLQTTLFLKVAEREDLKFEFKPRWLQRLLSQGFLKSLFLFFGDVPGTFLSPSYLAVQDEEIRGVCREFGKADERIGVFGSLQQATIVERRECHLQEQAGLPSAQRPMILFLTECIEERFGMDMARNHLGWMKALQSSVAESCDLVLRFHPRESQAYRDLVKQDIGSAFDLDSRADPAESVSKADVVIGAFSMLLFDAQSAGIPTIFLDVGCDPIGFYSSRRQPLAYSGADVCRNVDDALQQGTSPLAADLGGRQWGIRVLDWIEGIVRNS